MPENINEILRRIANPFLFGNIIISLCAFSLFLETYVLLGLPAITDGLAFLVFFSTLFLYNAHRLLSLFRIKPEDYGLITGWSAKHRFTLLMLALIGVGGMGFFVFQTSLTIFFVLVTMGAISFLYELPIKRFNSRFQGLRNLWLHKVFMITTVWTLTTVLLPVLNAGISLLDYHVWMIVLERFLFIFMLALCFDARDFDFDQRDGLQTIPIRFGMKRTEQLYKIAAVGLILFSVIHFVVLQQWWGIAVAMLLSTVATYRVVFQSYPRKSDLYYLFIVDGMMIAQFVLVWLLSKIGY